MNVKLKVLRKILEEAIANIDAGNSNHSDDELDDIISSLTKLNRGIKRISKREACERILHCSPSSFDNYIKLGLIPRGHKEYGFKELSWSEKDFDKVTLARIKKYIMVERKVIVDKVSTFVVEKLNEVLDSNPFSFIIKPYVSRVANNYIGKLDGLLKAIEDKDGKIDIEGILSESIDNLVVAQVKKYPNVFSGVEIGGGTIKINIPSFDKQLVFDYNDIETFKQNILN